MTKRQVGEEMVSLTYTSVLLIIEGFQDRNSIRTGIWRLELIQRPWREAVMHKELMSYSLGNYVGYHGENSLSPLNMFPSDSNGSKLYSFWSYSMATVTFRSSVPLRSNSSYVPEKKIVIIVSSIFLSFCDRVILHVVLGSENKVTEYSPAQ